MPSFAFLFKVSLCLVLFFSVHCSGPWGIAQLCVGSCCHTETDCLFPYELLLLGPDAPQQQRADPLYKLLLSQMPHFAPGLFLCFHRLAHPGLGKCLCVFAALCKCCLQCRKQWGACVGGFGHCAAGRWSTSLPRVLTAGIAHRLLASPEATQGCGSSPVFISFPCIFSEALIHQLQAAAFLSAGR